MPDAWDVIQDAIARPWTVVPSVPMVTESVINWQADAVVAALGEAGYVVLPPSRTAARNGGSDA